MQPSLTESASAPSSVLDILVDGVRRPRSRTLQRARTTDAETASSNDRDFPMRSLTRRPRHPHPKFHQTNPAHVLDLVIGVQRGAVVRPPSTARRKSSEAASMSWDHWNIFTYCSMYILFTHRNGRRWFRRVDLAAVAPAVVEDRAVHGVASVVIPQADNVRTRRKRDTHPKGHVSRHRFEAPLGSTEAQLIGTAGGRGRRAIINTRS